MFSVRLWLFVLNANIFQPHIFGGVEESLLKLLRLLFQVVKEGKGSR